jgi:hypothetical protein
MRYAVDPSELIALWDTWDEVRDRLVAARGRLPDGGGVYLSGHTGVLDSAVESLFGAVRACLTDAASAADEAGLALAQAAAAYRQADSVVEGSG